MRELENIVERLVNLCEGLEIICADLPDSLQEMAAAHVSGEELSSLQNLERSHITQVLEEQKGNLRQSAQQLGISRTALYNKLNAWQIDYRTFRKRPH